WRPIVTMEVDGQRKHEVVLGVDGQNRIREKLCFCDHDAHHRTQIKLDVWHKSQSKTKSRRRRHHVASALIPLGEVMRKQGTDPYVELCLSGVRTTRKKSMMQKRHPCASLLVRLRPPPSAVRDNDGSEDDVSLLGSDKSPSDTLVTPVTDEPENTPPWASGVFEEQPSGLRRRKIDKGYCIDSGEECSGESDYCLSEGETEETACDPWEPSISPDEYPTTPRQIPSDSDILSPDNVSATSGASLASSAFDMLTYHRELREAQMDSDFDRILSKLLSEWYYTGASLLSIAAVFGFSPDHLFNVDSFAKRSLIISSVAAAIGLFVDVWFIFAYSGADVRKFHTLAVDVYGSYFFFSLSSRLPLFALIVSALALVGFLGAVA
ncbi:hypothetical protein BJV77DRAFT_1022858, partial [Russula vinacea]